MLYLINVVLRNVTSVLEVMETNFGSWASVRSLHWKVDFIYIKFSAVPYASDAEQCNITPMKDGSQKLYDLNRKCCDPKIGEGGYMKLEIKNASPSCPLRIVSFNIIRLLFVNSVISEKRNQEVGTNGTFDRCGF